MKQNYVVSMSSIPFTSLLLSASIVMILSLERQVWANSLDPDQTAPRGTV